jgi:hypothetical protein
MTASSTTLGAQEVLMAIDPVCGMSVDQRTAAATRLHAGTTYYPLLQALWR